MTDTVVERLARAMCWAHCQEEWELRPDLMCDGAANCIEWKDEVPAARAALQALEEPTPEMKIAGALVLCEMEDDDSPSEFAARIFTAMIRRAQEG